MASSRTSYREILPKPAQPPSPPTSSSGGEPPRKQRRKIANACDCCKKKKMKCDGVRPRCAQCVKARADCVYAVDQAAQQRNEDEARAARYQSVIDLLRNGSVADSARALESIRKADDVEDAVSSIAEARLLLPPPGPGPGPPGPPNDGVGFMRHRGGAALLRSPHEDSDFMFEKQFMTSPRDEHAEKDVFVDVASRGLPLSRWTMASSDDRLMNHLLTLFFTWDNIVERCIHRPILEADIVNMESSSPADAAPGGFCSRFLINALLAASCLYTMDPATFEDPGDPKSRGRRWADEADALLECITEPSLALVQGLLAMFVYEGNLGSGAKSLQYRLRSFDAYRALNETDKPARRPGMDEARVELERQAFSWCMWGFYCTEWRATQAIGTRKPVRKPKAALVWREHDFPLSRPDCVGYWWFPYPMSVDGQPSMQVEVREADFRLSVLVEELLDFTYPEEGQEAAPADPRRAVELYDAMVDWKLTLPGRIRVEEAALPSTILLHVAVELLLACLLRPFSGMTKREFGRFDPRKRCLAHASSTMSATWTFRSLACIRFEYWLFHPIGTSAYIVVHEADEAPMHMDTLVRACRCLHEMSAMLPLATDVLSGIRAAFKRCGVPVPGYLGRYFDKVRHRKDGLMHHMVAAVLPSSGETGRGRAELQLQELLDDFDEMQVD